MKILCVIDNLGPGGAQRQLVNLALGFKNKGHHVSFLVYHRSDFYKSLLEDNGISVNYVQENNYIKRIFKMRSVIRDGQYDSVLAFLQASSFIATIAGFPYRHWKLVVGERSANPNILKSLKLRFYRWFHFFTDHVVANSSANIRLVWKANPLLPKRKCKVIYNAVNRIERTPSNFDPNGRLNIVVGASHRLVKNSISMAKAVNQLSREEKAKLKIVWYGDQVESSSGVNCYTETLSYIKDHGLEKIIEFRPANSNFSSIVEKSDVVALFSRYEGLPNLICEGMALGKPVMCSKISDIPFFLKHSPQQMFDSDNIESIKETFQYYIHIPFDEYQKISRQNYEAAKMLFAPTKIIDDYLELLQ